MPSQHTTEEPPAKEGIVVPLDLPELHILSQEWQANGTIRIEVIATTTQAACPDCQKICVKIHDTRPRKKRDISLREHPIELILLKRRFRCLHCGKSFTEPDTACGWRRKTTARLREAIGKHACTQHVMKGFKKLLSSWAHKSEGKPLLQGKQYLFLTAKEDLTEEQRQERAQIGVLLPQLEAAWQLKEDLRSWYATANTATAASELDIWIEKVRQQGPDALRKTLSAFKNWREEILAFFHFLPTRLSNGFVEGKNNRTKALMRQGYGYRNRRHLRLRILLEVA